VSEALAAYLSVPVDGYGRPIFLGVGLLDRDVPPNSTLTLVEQLRQRGQDLTFAATPIRTTAARCRPHSDSTPFLRMALGGGAGG
jgi:hypothetical protein